MFESLGIRRRGSHALIWQNVSHDATVVDSAKIAHESLIRFRCD